MSVIKIFLPTNTGKLIFWKLYKGQIDDPGVEYVYGSCQKSLEFGDRNTLI